MAATSPDGNRLPDLRANLTEATQALLADSDAPQREFLTRYAEALGASRALSRALEVAAPQVSTELAEAYAQEAASLPACATFLLLALSERRRRRGLE